MKDNYTDEDVQKLGLSNADDGDSLISNGNWENWNNQSGLDVQGFIKKQLASTVASFEYIPGSSKLIGYNTQNDLVCEAEVTVTEPTYDATFEITGFRKKGVNLTADTSYPYESSATYELGVSLLLISTKEGADAVVVKKSFPISLGILGTNKLNSYRITSSGEETWFNVTDLVQAAGASTLANLQFVASTEIVETGQTYSDTSEAYKLIKLALAVGSKSAILTNNKLEFKVTGATSGNFKLQYFAETVENLQGKNSGSLNSDEPVVKNGSVTITFLNPGVYEVFARVISSDNNEISSEWILTNVLATLGYSGTPLIVAQNIASTIQNCNSSELFKVVGIPSLGGSTSITSYLADDTTTLFNNVFKAGTYNDLLKNDSNIEESFYSYNEFSELSESNSTRFLGLEITLNGKTYKLVNLKYNSTTKGIRILNYFTIQIVNPESNSEGQLLCPENDSDNLNFSLIVLQNNNIFTSIDPDLSSQDGYNIEENITSFKVSALYKDTDERGLINGNGIDLSALLNLPEGFSFEVTYKAEHVNGDDAAFSLGNILFGPGYCRVYAGETDAAAPLGVWIQSKATYSKTDVNHILLVYQKNYTPSTYEETYLQLFGESDFNKKTSYDVLKVYVNGVINRAIEISTETFKTTEGFYFLIKPITSDLKFYTIRTFSRPLSFAEVQRSKISSFASLSDKEAFYSRNDILNESGQIDFYKAYKKYNVAVMVLPEGESPLWYGNKDLEGSGEEPYVKEDRAIIIHHKEAFDKESKYYTEGYSGVWNDFSYKAQGSSAKKYMLAHNVQASKGKWKSLKAIEDALANDIEVSSLKPLKYVPMSDGTKPKKMVAKVNTASSMQSHKLGATKVFNDAWKKFNESTEGKGTYTPGDETTRCAVYEEPFLYFYVNVPAPSSVYTCEDFFDVTTNILGTTTVDYKYNVNFFGFWTWGSGKADKPVFGYSDETPEFILLEGADNGSPGANFKQPWASFQCWNANHEYELAPKSITESDPFTNLQIKDETIRFETGTDPWDIDYGCEEYENDKGYYYIPDKAKNSFRHFIDFYNGCYEFDFSSLQPWEGNTFNEANTASLNTQFRYYFTKATTFVKASGNNTQLSMFDVVRYDAYKETWVPAGLHYANGNWETYNLKNYVNYIETRAKLYNIDYDSLGILVDEISSKDVVELIVIPAYKIMFQQIMEQYVDTNNLAYHQSFTRTHSGTDNRAKNIYLAIFGTRYSQEEKADEVTKIHYTYSWDNVKGSGYTIGDTLYLEDGTTKSTSDEVTVDGVAKKVVDCLTDDFCVKTSNSSYKIKAYQDDIDTIFETDNNGQQLKPHYLLEPPFDKRNESYWGDNHSSFFYPFDICFAKKINEYTQKLLEFLVGEHDNLAHTECPFYQYYFYVLKYFPEIAYNHTSEIYYEMPLMFYKDGLRASGISSLSGFTNNNVATPLSLSHGSSYESELDFMTRRLKFLGGLCNTLFNLRGTTSVISSGSGGSGSKVSFAGNAKFVDYAGPGAKIVGSGSSTALKIVSNPAVEEPSETTYPYYDPIFKNLIEDGTVPEILENLAYPSSIVPNESYQFNTGNVDSLQGLLLADTDLYKEVEITSGQELSTSLIRFNSASAITIDASNASCNIGASTVLFSDIYPVVETLILHNIHFTGTNVTLDFRGCSRLKSVDLSNCTGIYSVIIPANKNLTELILPSSVKVLSLGYVPNLSTEHLQIEDCKFTNITIDAGNLALFKYIVNKNVANSPETLTINNLKNTNFYIPLTTLDDILQFKLISYLGKIYIGDEAGCVTNEGKRSSITWKLKLALAELWGNIDSSTNDVQVLYKIESIKTVSIAATTTLQKDGIPSYGVSMKGNNIKILGNHLAFDFAKVGTSDAQQKLITVDSTTGSIAINNAVSETLVNIQLIVTLTDNTSITATSSVGNAYIVVTIGFYTPQLGDFAYADGTFSPYYEPNNSPVGFVYYTQETNANSVEVRVMALKASSTDKAFGPAYFLTTDTSEYKNERLNLNAAVNSLNVEGYYNSYSCGSNHITGDTTIYLRSNPELPSSLNSGKTVCETYIGLANKLITALQNKNYQVDDLTDANYTSIENILDSLSGDSVFTLTAAYSKLLFPAVQRAYRYSSTMPNLNTVYTKSNHWYIPSMEEITWIIQNIIAGQYAATVSGSNIGDSSWCKTQFLDNGSGFFVKMYKAIVNSTTKSIGDIVEFLGINNKISAESNASGVYTYGTLNYGTTTPAWFNPGYTWDPDAAYKDLTSKTIVPCITLNLSKS